MLKELVILLTFLNVYKIQQSINLLGGKELFAQKKEVEGNFKVFKSKLATKDKASIPKLPHDEKEWYVILHVFLLLFLVKTNHCMGSVDINAVYIIQDCC